MAPGTVNLDRVERVQEDDVTGTNQVLITDKVAPECLEVIRSEPGFEVVYEPDASPTRLGELLATCNALIVRSGTQVTAEMMDQAPNLKVVARAGVGVDNIDVDAATRRGILVMNAPEGNTVAAAEHTIALLFSVVRHIPAADRALREGRWERSSFVGTQLTGKILGLIGLGKVGREVALRARGLCMDVVAFDPVVTADQASKYEVALLTLEQVIARSDVLSVHVPLTERTRGLLSDAEFAAMKPGAIVLNCSRGGVVDEAALSRALNSGHLRGAGLDVFSQEPPLPEALASLAGPRTVLTPHLGASTREAQELVGELTARQVVANLRDEAITNAVNMVRIDPQVAKRLAPFRLLAEKLGSLQAQLLHGKIEGIEINYAGGAFDDEAKPLLTRAVLTGFFRHFLDAPVNYVSVPHFSKEIGLQLSESSGGSSEGYRDLLSVRVHTTEGSRRLSGTLFGERRPRIIRVDNYDTDVSPEGHLLFFANDDTPGIMGMAGTTLGNDGVNIAYMSMGRDQAGGTALAVLGIDSPLPDKTRKTLEQARGILWVRPVQL